MSEEIESPNYLATPEQGKGMRRYNKVPLYVFFAVVVFAAIIFIYGGIKRFSDPETKEREEEKPKQMETTASPPVTKPEGPDVMLPPAPPPEVFSAPPPQMQPYPAGPQGLQVPENVRKRIAAEETARSVASSVVYSRKDQPAPQQMELSPARSRDPEIQQARYDDPNRQQEKKDFLKSFDPTEIYLKQTRMPAASPFQLNAGHIIPGIMLGGVNSDLPGQIIGQVRQNVYDSATGQHLLIPAGSRLVGTYDSSVAAGQERVLVAWNRVMFPDGSSLSLEGMPGADQSGFAGFRDQVDNHYWRTFGNAFMLSIFSAGIQLSQPRAAVGGTYNSQQIMAAALGQQLGQLGMRMAYRNLNIQPTLEIRPGYNFSIMITKDMILPPWRG